MNCDFCFCLYPKMIRSFFRGSLSLLACCSSSRMGKRDRRDLRNLVGIRNQTLSTCLVTGNFPEAQLCEILYTNAKLPAAVLKPRLHSLGGCREPLPKVGLVKDLRMSTPQNLNEPDFSEGWIKSRLLSPAPPGPAGCVCGKFCLTIDRVC